MNEVLSYRVFKLTLPLRSSIPVGTTRWHERPVVLLRGEDTQGHVAWGEAAPLDGYGPDSLNEVVAALQMSNPASVPPSLACAIGTVRLGMEAARASEAFGFHLGPVQTDILRPAVLGTAVDTSNETGPIKLKVSGSSLEEADRLASVMKAHPMTTVRLDANGQLTPDGTRQLLDHLGDLTSRIEFFEEPFPGCFESDHRGDFPVPLAIDESLQADNWRHADVCVIKPSLMGDPSDTWDFAQRVHGTGRRVVVSSAFESAVGMTMVTWLAARLGDAAPGLGTYRFMAEDLGGRSSLWDAPGVHLNEARPIPSVTDAALKAALTTPAQQHPGSIRLEELSIPEGACLNR